MEYEIGTLTISANHVDGDNRQVHPILSIPGKGFAVPSCKPGVMTSQPLADILMKILQGLPSSLQKTGHTNIHIELKIDDRVLNANSKSTLIQQLLLDAHRRNGERLAASGSFTSAYVN